MPAQFREITFLKPDPLLGLVREPAAKRCARRNIPEPGVEPEIDFPDSARPEPFDKEADAIVRLGFFVDAFQNEHGACLRAPDQDCESADQIEQWSGIDAEPNQQQCEDG